MLPKVAQIVATFVYKVIIYKIAQNTPIFWDTFVRKFGDKNFQKSPNLVTLDGHQNFATINRSVYEFSSIVPSSLNTADS